MFVVLWEFEVKPGCEERFETVYGPGGDWASLFRRDAQYVQTDLLHDLSKRGVYLTTDYWRSRAAFEAFLATHQAEYQLLDAANQELTASERKICAFERIGTPRSALIASQ
jgi:hypothetical protein